MQLEFEPMLRSSTDPAALRADHDRLGAAAVEAGRLMLAEWLAQLPDAYD